MENINVMKEYRNNDIKINNYKRKLEFFARNKQFRVKELEEMPETRQNIKDKAKELYDKSTEYRLKGFNKKSRSYMNQGSVVIKRLKAISRFRKRKEIHRANRSIRELEGRINPLQQDQINKESTIKDALFREFLGGL